VQVSEAYWREKEKVLIPGLKVAAHQCIIAHKSPYFAQFFKEQKASSGSKNPSEDRTLIIDFNGAVCYEAFRKIIDYIYLDDHQWLIDQAAAEASSSTEMIETIKLAKQYKLESLFKACEAHFKELMVQSFDCTNLITLKGTNPYALKGGSQRGTKSKEDQVPSSS